MNIDMSNEERFQVGGWWATSPSYVLAAITAQLRAAATIWPELEGMAIGTLAPRQMLPEMPGASTSDVPNEERDAALHPTNPE